MRNPNRSTAVATRRFFQWLEEKFGDGTLPMDTTAKVLTTDRLSYENVSALLSNQHLALHIREFYPKESARSLGQRLSNEALTNHQDTLQNWKISTSQGLQASDVFTLGQHVPYNVAVATSTVPDYYQQVPHELHTRRRSQAPTGEQLLKNATDKDIDSGNSSSSGSSSMVWPLDWLRLELDEVWPYGAGLGRNPENLQQCKSGGLPRIMMGPTRWKQGFVHVDHMAPLSSDEGYFSANVYLQLPPNNTTNTKQENNNNNNNNNNNDNEGQAVLEIWPLDIRSKWDWYKNAPTLSALASQDAEGQVLLRSKLGEPTKILVQPGDLVMLNVQRPHCAIGFDAPNSVRVSLQCFLEYNGANQRLVVES